MIAWVALLDVFNTLLVVLAGWGLTSWNGSLLLGAAIVSHCQGMERDPVKSTGIGRDTGKVGGPEAVAWGDEDRNRIVMGQEWLFPWSVWSKGIFSLSWLLKWIYTRSLVVGQSFSSPEHSETRNHISKEHCSRVWGEIV